MRVAVRCAILATVLGVLPGRAAADNIYLALGDSSAFGETNRTQNPSNGDRGYVKPFADYLATQYGGVRPGVVNLAIDGETTVSFKSGVEVDRVSRDNAVSFNTNYAPPYASQQRLMQQTITSQLAAGNAIPVVTLQLGANDLFAAATQPGFLTGTPEQQAALLGAALLGPGGFFDRYGEILRDIRARLPAADIYAIGYHNPYPGAPSDSESSIFAGPSVGGVQFLNSVIADAGGLHGAKYVDFYTPLVGREAELTHIALKDANGQYDYVNDVHLTAAGYQIESQQLIGAASPVPAPPALALACVGAVLLGTGRLVRRKGAPATAA